MENKKHNLEETSSFTDIMSRSERKKLEKIKQEIEQEEFETQKKQILKIKEEMKENEEAKGKWKKTNTPTKKENVEAPISSREKEVPKGKKNILSITLGTLLSLCFLALLGILCYMCFIQKDFGKKELLANGILLIPLFFAAMACFLKEKWKKGSIILCDITLILAILATLAIKFGYIKLNNTQTLPDFSNQILTEVLEYTKKHSIPFEQIYEYSDQIEEYHVIYQNVKAGTPLKNVKDLSITISSGPNYDKEIILPNIVGKNIDEVLEIIQEYFLNNVVINYTFHEDIKKDTVISQSITGQMKRNAELVIEVSLGLEEDLSPTSMIDLKNKSLFEATLWLKRNGISYELQYEFSDSINRNCVLSQNVQPGVSVDPKTGKVILIISKGKQIKVPNLLSMTSDEVVKWITENRLKISFEDRYDTSAPLGTIIEANYKEGDIIEEGTNVKIITSKGQLRMKTFTDINEFRSWASRYNIKYKEEYEFNNSVSQGSIINFSVDAESILDPNQEIVVRISNGKAIVIPNFIGSTKSSIQSQCNSLGLSCSFYYQNSSKAKDIAIAQNKRSGSEVIKGTPVRIGLSNGTSENNGNNGNTNTCTGNNTYTLIIQPSWVTGGNANTTINTLKSKFASKYPNVKFNFQTKAGNNPSGYIHESSPITNGSTIKDCNTYTIIITE